MSGINDDDTAAEEEILKEADKNDFIASDSDEKPRRGGPRPHIDSGIKRIGLRRAALESDDEKLSLREELRELKEEATPPRRKHLRERKEVNYQILPPPPLEHTTANRAGANSGRLRKVVGPVRQLFRTEGPFGGSDTISIFGQNPTINNEEDSDSDYNPIPPSSSGPALIGAAPVNGKNKLADSDPLGIDANIDFSVVGGLDSYIDQLKEMVSLPLKYPEVYQRFGVTPPRGVLFHGPPGTGKTLMARALAASCSSEGKKVTFFMRKGADCLSKWVGEAERQLRLLFEEAKNQQPSIIFFDEIDGLAPVRSSKQEQIHASIVSTLLALMDGMDNRGQVIVIGATNRPDSVDSALRRPGRFDREFYFPLPDLEARKKIITIHTRKWDPPLQDSFVSHIARATKGYGGADLRALCTEAALAAIQRRYPQIYQNKEKLLIDPSSIHVSARDFMKSVEKIVPSSARSTSSSAAPLPTHVEPLLSGVLDDLKKKVDNYIPRKKKITPLEEAMLEDFDDADGGFARLEATKEFQTSRVFRPRLLVYGAPGMGQQYIGAAILHHLEGYHIQSFDLGTLLIDSTRTPEAMIIQLLVEVKRHTPSVIFIPNLDSWFATISPIAKSTFMSFLRDLKPTDSILVLALMEDERANVDPQVNALFGYSSENIYEIPATSKSGRKKFFELLFKYIRSKPTDFPDLENRPKRKLEVLPVAPIAPEKDLTEIELKQRKRRDMQIKNKLKIKLSAIMDPIKNRYKKFKKPYIDHIYLLHLFVGNGAAPQIAPGMPIQYEQTENDMIREVATGKLYFNMDLDVIEERLWNGYYSEPKQFLADIKMIHADSLTSGDRERIVKSSEMLTNTQVYIDELTSDTAFMSECAGMKEREREQELREKADHAKLETEQAAIEAPKPMTDGTILTTEHIMSTTQEEVKVNGYVNGHAAGQENGYTIVQETVIESTTTTMETDVHMADQHAEIPMPESEMPKLEASPEPQAEIMESSPALMHSTPVQEPMIEPEPESEPVPEPPLLLSEDLLAKFSKKLVSSSKGLSIERIEQVNSSLIDTLWSLRLDWDRNSIIARLEEQLEVILKAIKSSNERQNELDGVDEPDVV